MDYSLEPFHRKHRRAANSLRVTDFEPRLEDDLVDWVNSAGGDLLRAWRDCPRGDWLLELASALPVDRRYVVKAATACLRVRFERTRELSVDERICIEKVMEASEGWADGTIESGELFAMSALVRERLEEDGEGSREWDATAVDSLAGLAAGGYFMEAQVFRCAQKRSARSRIREPIQARRCAALVRQLIPEPLVQHAAEAATGRLKTENAELVEVTGSAIYDEELYPLPQWFLAFDDLETAWNLCPRPSWMLAAATAVGVDRKLLIEGACFVASRGLHLIPELHPGMVAPGRLRKAAARGINCAAAIARGEMSVHQAAGVATELGELTGNLFNTPEPGTPAAYVWHDSLF
ncbi:MAG TPA: hypothetical protein VGJ84_19130, partial [Polyangiaceae bacterium]